MGLPSLIFALFLFFSLIPRDHKKQKKGAKAGQDKGQEMEMERGGEKKLGFTRFLIGCSGEEIKFGRKRNSERQSQNTLFALLRFS